MPFLEVGALPVPASLYYFYVVVRGGFIETLVKHSSLLRRQCEQGVGSVLTPWRIFLKLSVDRKMLWKTLVLEVKQI